MDFYHRSALILDSLDAKKGSVKGLCMAEAKRGKFHKEGEASRFLKVIVQVLKFRPHLSHLITKTNLLVQEPTLFVAPVWADPASTKVKAGSAASAIKSLDKGSRKVPKKTRPIPTPLALANIMVHDMMFAKRGLTLPKEHKVRKKLEKYKSAMEKETEKEKKRKKVSSVDGLQIALPEPIAASIEGIGKGKKKEIGDPEEGGTGAVRWLRVNTLKWTVEEAVEWLESERWELYEDMESMLEAATSKSKVFALDAHIEPLLAFPIGVSLPSLQPYQDSRFIAQDKASCIPAWILLSQVLAVADVEAEQEAAVPVDDISTEEKDIKMENKKPKGVKVLDATAAPGNKTTMAAAMAGDHGRIVAVERDAGRFKVLKGMCQKAGCRNVVPMNVDFLSIDPQDNKFKNISHFLVDPSCSGSGIPTRLDHLLPSEPEAEAQQRIRALSNFQLTILSHAMRFTGARRVVYSTCSIWEQEDEGVVMRVLAKREFQEKGWRLASRDEVVPNWERRGRIEACGGDESVADSLLRCLPEDQTNGFFVACFVRDFVEDGLEEGEGNTSVNIEAVPYQEAPLTHVERQEAFKAKSKAKGGKGAPVSVRLAAATKPKSSPEAAEKKGPKSTKKGDTRGQLPKSAKPGKKEAYLAQKELLQKQKRKSVDENKATSETGSGQTKKMKKSI